MKGLELCEQYWDKIGMPALESRFPEITRQLAFGLAGDGSECLGYDDDYSQDHDFGPGFCIWIRDEDNDLYGSGLQRFYEELPKDFEGFHGRNTMPQGTGRVGVIPIRDFYRRYTGCPEGPESLLQWLSVPEHFLAKAVSGKVFRDDCGNFTRIREKLLGFYPEEVRWKKLAARAVTMAQSGQYNYPRALKRGDDGAAFFALREFEQASLSMGHLLARKYMPYYKWSWRSFCDLDILESCRTELRMMMRSPMDGGNPRRIEHICDEVRKVWQAQGLSPAESDFLEPVGWELYRRISSEELRHRHILDG